ncbi:MAG: 30S ribosomal protein S8 [Bacilli bacterium]|nr:30S ribosomal protein S8 [Bacilli bacterium]
MLMDPISDMLTRIRNANALRYETVSMPSSKMKVEITKILKEEGFITDYKVSENKVKKELTITLKYGPKQERVISGLKKISKPGLRVTSDTNHLPRVLKGLGIAIISTSKGVMTDTKARALGVGGEVLAYIW